MDMTQNCSLLPHKGNFPGKSRNNKTAEICLKYSLMCAGASVLERYLKNNRVSPKTTVQRKSESEKNLESGDNYKFCIELCLCLQWRLASSVGKALMIVLFYNDISYVSIFK